MSKRTLPSSKETESATKISGSVFSSDTWESGAFLTYIIDANECSCGTLDPASPKLASDRRWKPNSFVWFTKSHMVWVFPHHTLLELLSRPPPPRFICSTFSDLVGYPKLPSAHPVVLAGVGFFIRNALIRLQHHYHSSSCLPCLSSNILEAWRQTSGKPDWMVRFWSLNCHILHMHQ